MDSCSLENKHIIVTGASSGIGRACAIRFSELGARVSLIARNEQRLAETLSQLSGSGHRCYTCDLSALEEIEPLIAKIVAEQGKADGLMYCAGDCYRYPLKACKPALMQKSMQVNFFAFTETLRCVTKNKNSNDGASIVTMSSSSSLKGDKALLSLSAAKAAMNAAVRCAARELADRKIRVNAIAASYIGGSIMVAETVKIFGEEQVERFLRESQPLGMGQPEQVAAAAAFLMSSASDFITGTIMSVDGGYMA